MKLNCLVCVPNRPGIDVGGYLYGFSYELVFEFYLNHTVRLTYRAEGTINHGRLDRYVAHFHQSALNTTRNLVGVQICTTSFIAFRIIHRYWKWKIPLIFSMVMFSIFLKFLCSKQD